MGFEPTTCDIVNALLYPLSYSETRAEDRFETDRNIEKYLLVWITSMIDSMWIEKILFIWHRQRTGL
jgi:hypothetical protein